MPEETNEQLVAKAQGGDRRASEQLIKQNSGLLHLHARRWLKSTRTATIEDLIAEGSLGILKAIEKYDSSFGAKFTTYAVSWIDHYIRRAAQDDAAVVSGLKGERRHKIIKEVNAGIASGLSREDAETAVSKKLSMGKEVVSAGSRIGQIGSLDVPIGDSDQTQLDKLTSGDEFRADDTLIAEERKNAVRSCIRTMQLSSRERAIVERRMLGDESLEDIGITFNLSKERIRQIESKLLPRLRLALKGHLAGGGQRNVVQHSDIEIQQELNRLRLFAARRGFTVEWADAVHRLKFPYACQT